MQRARAALALLLCAVCLSPAMAAFDVDVPEQVPDEPFDIQAARLEYTNNTILATGGVTGRFENVTVRADSVSGNPDSGDLHMEGDVFFERDNVVWQGSDLDYNYLSETGDFGPSTLNFDPVLMSVDHVERVSTNEYLLRGAEFTTCPQERRHFHVRAKEAQLVDEKYLKAKGVTVYLGRVPVLYVPYWRQKLTKSIFSVRLGYSSEWGGFFHVRATVPVTENVDSLTDVNLYSSRGVGVGQGFEWKDPKSQGGFSAFYIDDQDPYSKYDSLYARNAITENRYRLKLEEIYGFTDTHYINTKWNYLSDPAVLEEFFKREYRYNVQPENYGAWVYGNSYVGSEAFISTRLNDFYDNVNRIEYNADLYRTRLGDTPFYFQSENSVSHLEKVYAETNRLDKSYNTVRVDSDNGIYMPQEVGFVSLVPRATYRGTYYADTDSLNGGGEDYRGIPGAGMEVSMQATKVLSDRTRWYGSGLRHKFQPYVDYNYEDSSITTNRLLQFDEVDEQGDENTLKLGLRNVLQTKRSGRTSRFIDFDLFTYYRFDENGEEDQFSPLFLDSRMELTQRLRVDVEGIIDWNEGTIPFFDTRINYFSDDITYSLEHLYQTHERSLWTPRIKLYPEGDVSLEAYARYDDNTNDIQEIATIFYKNFCCMRYGLGAHFYDGNEVEIMLSIGLSDFPEARLGSGM